MPIGIAKEIMPHVRFENKAYGRNEELSVKLGRPVPNNATFIIITSHGSKDSSEQIADEWLPRKRLEASKGAYNIEWVEFFEKQYAAFKAGHELPRQGTPIMTWQMAKPEQQSRLISGGITTVEDLSAVPDSGVNNIGLDGRELRDLARAWIAEGQQKGINAQELAHAKTEIERQREVIDRLNDRLVKLEAKLIDEAPVRKSHHKARQIEAA